MNELYFSSKNIIEGHPNKICDKIADSILDYTLSQDINSKMTVKVSEENNFNKLFEEANTKCEIGVSYAIGYTKPISIFIDTFGTSKISEEELNKVISKNFDFSVTNIIKELDLLRPIYAETSCYDHFLEENNLLGKKLKS